jgi:hypothetical protein
VYTVINERSVLSFVSLSISLPLSILQQCRHSTAGRGALRDVVGDAGAGGCCSKTDKHELGMGAPCTYVRTCRCHYHLFVGYARSCFQRNPCIVHGQWRSHQGAGVSLTPLMAQPSQINNVPIAHYLAASLLFGSLKPLIFGPIKWIS